MNKKRKRLVEAIDRLDAMGQESDAKAAPAVIDANKAVEKKEKEKEAKRLDVLEKSQTKIITYREQVIRFLHEMILEIQIPQNYQWGVWHDGRGVRLTIVDKYGGGHQRAFKLCHDPKYDLHACYRFSVWAEDVIDRIEGNLETRQIWTPPKTN